jgi:hypothetical protein
MERMANYIAIIELHDAESEGDFQQLDVAMQERRFLSQIQTTMESLLWLLTGSYAIQNTDMVLKATYAAVAAAG